MAATWVMVGLAVASAVKGISDSNKAEKQNEQAARESKEAEEARRKEIQKNIEDFFRQYNELREEREGMTIEEYIQDRLKVLNNKELEDRFRSLVGSDFEQAQHLADLAYEGNIQNFKKGVQELSGGFYEAAVKKRNEIANATNSEEAYKRAMEIYAPFVPVGSVEPGDDKSTDAQRAYKGAFQVAYEVDKEQQALQYQRLSDIIANDRNLAISQQERAATFLPHTSFLNYGTNLHLSQRRDQLAMQLADESFLQSIISSLFQQGYTDQTRTPSFKDTSASDKMVSEGISAAIKGTAQLSEKYNNPSTTQPKTSSTVA